MFVVLVILFLWVSVSWQDSGKREEEGEQTHMHIIRLFYAYFMWHWHGICCVCAMANDGGGGDGDGTPPWDALWKVVRWFKEFELRESGGKREWEKDMEAASLSSWWWCHAHVFFFFPCLPILSSRPSPSPPFQVAKLSHFELWMLFKFHTIPPQLSPLIQLIKSRERERTKANEMMHWWS